MVKQRQKRVQGLKRAVEEVERVVRHGARRRRQSRHRAARMTIDQPEATLSACDPRRSETSHESTTNELARHPTDGASEGVDQTGRPGQGTQLTLTVGDDIAPHLNAYHDTQVDKLLAAVTYDRARETPAGAKDAQASERTAPRGRVVMIKRHRDVHDRRQENCIPRSVLQGRSVPGPSLQLRGTTWGVARRGNGVGDRSVEDGWRRARWGRQSVTDQEM